MRHFLSIFSFLIFLNSFSQDPSKIPNKSTSTWMLHKGEMYCNVNGSLLLFINGDSLLDGLLYEKIYYKNKISYFGGGPYCSYNTTFSSGFHGLIRSENSKVYFKLIQGVPEELLFDFTLSVGDTLPASMIHTCNCLEVVSIETVTINGIDRKKFNVSNINMDYNTWIIEGVGSEFGLDERMDLIIDYIPYSLSCYGEDGEVQYGVDDDCSLILSTKNVLSLGKVVISPNPITSELKISFDSPASGQLDVSLKSALSSEVLNEKMPLIVGENHLDFHLPDLTRGMYFLIISNGNQILLTEKFVVQ